MGQDTPEIYRFSLGGKGLETIALEAQFRETTPAELFLDALHFMQELGEIAVANAAQGVENTMLLIYDEAENSAAAYSLTGNILESSMINEEENTAETPSLDESDSLVIEIRGEESLAFTDIIAFLDLDIVTFANQGVYFLLLVKDAQNEGKEILISAPQDEYYKITV